MIPAGVRSHAIGLRRGCDSATLSLFIDGECISSLVQFNSCPFSCSNGFARWRVSAVPLDHFPVDVMVLVPSLFWVNCPKGSSIGATQTAVWFDNVLVTPWKALFGRGSNLGLIGPRLAMPVDSPMPLAMYLELGELSKPSDQPQHHHDHRWSWGISANPQNIDPFVQIILQKNGLKESEGEFGAVLPMPPESVSNPRQGATCTLNGVL